MGGEMKSNKNILKIYTTIFLIAFQFCYAQVNPSTYSDSLLTLNKKFYNEGKFKEAVELYNKINFEKLSAEELFYLGLSYTNLRAVLKAGQYFKKASDLLPGNIGYKLQLARNNSLLGKANDAISNYNDIIQIDSNYVAAVYELGLIYFEKREFDWAIQFFNKLIKINPNDFLSRYYLGYSMLLSPNPNLAETAAKHLEHSVSANPEYIPAISLLASNKFSLQKYYDANALYSIARKLRPENANFYFQSGLCYERLKQYRDAVNLYVKAVTLDTTDANYFDHLGYSYFNLTIYDSAIAAYKSASLLEDNPTYFVNLGFAYAKLDSTNKSIQNFEKALKLMPFDKIGYIYNQIAAVHYSKNNFKESKKNYEKSFVYTPQNPDALFYIAMINDKQKDFKTASAAYKKFIEMFSSDSTQTERINYSQKMIKELIRKRVLYGNKRN
jgi:superkiller protein 3